MSDILIRLPSPAEQKDQHFIQHITNLVNEAYNQTETESKLYKPGKLRTNRAKVCDWLASENFYLAIKPDATLPIGSVRVHKLSFDVFDISILTVDREARSLGLGRHLSLMQRRLRS
jgi:hypothetical protein